ncbi:pantoate-beta-alanine ligase [Tasmannia lanceolata]|uniref:pantoate-beta-alanine ligase n=1 Tax=Tasmannia lanceolata TaxID=3420 RepID=UPI00406326A2
MAKEPEIMRDKDQMRTWSRSMRSKGKTLALVPTMGYLHQGHLSLIQEAQKHCQLTIVSIYINPGQFAPSEDLSTYPSDFQGDLEKLKKVGVDAVFCPKNLYDYAIDSKIPSGSYSDLGFDGTGERKVGSCDENGVEFGKDEKNPRGSSGDLGFEGGVKGKVVSCVEEKGDGRLGHETWVRVERLEKGLCGNSRPVFFRGVATIVAKLFNIVEPDVAVFGKKDYQQWRIIRRMVRDLDFGINVIGSEIVRDVDGLAMSSRNVHLLPEERDKALSINKALSKAKFSAQNGQISCKELRHSVVQAIFEAGGRVDYAEIVDQESLKPVEEIKSPVVFSVAAWFGKVRLIDNMEINV